MDKAKLKELKIAISHLSIATGVYDTTGVSIVHILKRYSVGTQRPKPLKSYFPEQKLMCPLRLLPTIATKSIRKGEIEATNMVGVFPLHKRTKMRDRIKDDSGILRNSIGEATIIKYIPQDKRLGVGKIIEKKQEPTKFEVHKLMDELLKKCINVTAIWKKILKI